ncbi:MAG: 1-acyl-sn-glycerol-3-phosphate acyltransferase [Treponema sp.]|nr:1-acyl-sn-glycerol-3-phosphate acyltransferase [Treponema sp.]
MGLVKTIAIFIVTVFVLLIFIPVAIPFFILRLIGLNQSMDFFLYKLAQSWARIVIVITGCSMTVTGRENIPKEGGICFVSNHVGIFDVILAVAYSGRPFGFIAKKELLLVPGINLWIFLLGGFFIDRKKPRKALKTINQGIKRINAGGAMLIFPEGTRSRGSGIGPFLPGALKLATHSKALIIPMAISGSYDVFEKTYRVIASPVSITFLSPVNPAEMSPQDRKTLLAEKLRTSIAETLNQQ